jgi:hypothetical protein
MSSCRPRQHPLVGSRWQSIVVTEHEATKYQERWLMSRLYTCTVVSLEISITRGAFLLTSCHEVSSILESYLCVVVRPRHTNEVEVAP